VILIQKTHNLCVIFVLPFIRGRSGYRIYFRQHGLTVYILLIGGNKATQHHDNTRAKELAREIKAGNYEHSDNPGF
jgi:hypothetical protein